MDEQALEQWITDIAGRPYKSLDRVGYGASRATYIADFGGDDLVARVDNGDGPMAGTELSLHREAEVYRALEGRGVRIPRLRAESPDGTVLLTERAAGTHETVQLADEQRCEVFDDYIDAMAELHRVDALSLSLPSYRRPTDGPSHAREELQLWGDLLRARTTGPWPLAHFTLAVLDRLAPTEVSRTVMCHGDIGPGNFMHDGHRVTALLDWEFSHLGDPMDDLAWWVFRGHDMSGNCGDLTAQLRRWSNATGLSVQPRSIEYYRAFVELRWLVSVSSALDGGGPGMDRSVYYGLVPVLSVRLSVSLAALLGIELAPVELPPPGPATSTAGVIDALTTDLRTVVGPAATTNEARRRLMAAELYLAHLQSVDRQGSTLRTLQYDDTAALVGRRPSNDEEAQRLVADYLTRPDASLEAALGWFWRDAHRQVALWPLVAPKAFGAPTPIPTI